ncbi:MAG: DUF190 domain-containing protein [Spirochaetia bacterium]|jgi:PII-like signaling protein|nr:DUF190 domain-containing protein [Spirochaetia bacterium]
MKISEKDVILRIYLGENNHIKGRPLYEQIVLEARKLHLAGATALHGILGFGADSRLHTSKILSLSDDLPVIVEIVDTEENINKILPYIDEHVTEGLVTMEDVKVIKYRRG